MARLGDVIEGLEILAKHCGRDSHEIAAEHDVIYAGPEVKSVRSIPDEDRKRLRELGWHFDSENSTWARFV